MNAHFQSRIAKRAVRDLQDQVQKQLLHAQCQWLNAIHLALWPFALKNGMHLHKNPPTEDENRPCLEQSSGINVGSRLANNYTFRCPIYALQNNFGSTIPKWKPCCHLGVDLGPSHYNAHNLYLVLNLSMGIVSTQFYVYFDDFFETVRYAPYCKGMPIT